MKRHAAVPKLKDLNGVRHKDREIVEQHIPGAAAEDDAERDPDNKVIEVNHGERRRSTPKPLRSNDVPRVKPTDENADNVGQRIPAHGQRPNVNEHGVYGGIRQDR